MKINSLLTVFILSIWAFSPHIFGQENDDINPNEQTALSDKLIEIDEVIKKVDELPYDALAPARAAFYSAVLPGLGQAYNKKYWKIPLVYGGIAGGFYFYQRNSKDYNRFRDAYKRRLAGYQDDEFQEVSDARLRDAQKTAGRNRDVSLAMAIGIYLLNILDANVDAHLLRYNLNENLSFGPKFRVQTIDQSNHYTLSLNWILP